MYATSVSMEDGTAAPKAYEASSLALMTATMSPSEASVAQRIAQHVLSGLWVAHAANAVARSEPRKAPGLVSKAFELLDEALCGR